MKIVFFGSSDFAIPSLRALAAAGRKPALVVTKPDAPRGRGRKIYPAVVRLGAEDPEVAVPCAQPAAPNAPEFLDQLRALAPDLGVVVSYGVILSRELLELPRLGCINAHASLLPRYRGAAPIEHAIRNGDAKTGVTIMQIVEELDAGPILLAHDTPIGPHENAGELRARLAEMSGPALLAAIDQLEAGKAKPQPQDDSQATRAPKLEKADGVIRWNRPATDIDLLVRAVTPWPGAQTRIGAKRFILLAGVIEPDLYGLGDPGRIQSAGEEGIRVCTGEDLYRITRLKPDNGRTMTAGEFVRGHPLPPDARFG